MKRIVSCCVSILVACNILPAQPGIQKQDTFYLLKPDQVFDGEQMREGWWVVVKNDRILTTGGANSQPTAFPQNTIFRIVDLRGKTLLPGFIEGHSHLFLHPYNETDWSDQVLEESRAERTARAVNHAKATLMAGFTTVRDLGTEGSEYDDAGLKTAIEKGIVPGPRMLVATKAIVATGSYGPKSASADIDFHKGAAEADGVAELTREIRTQIGKGADLIKLYADYRWGPAKQAAPTFTLEELKKAVEVAGSSGRKVVVHATTEEAMKRSIEAGVSSIEHGDDGTPELYVLMKQKGVALCPTLAATEAISQYKGWKKGIDPEPDRVAKKRQSFKYALAAGVTICMGGDVGVFAHGENVREMELMAEYGMQPLEVLRSATSVNADVFGISTTTGRIKAGLFADLVAVEGNPLSSIKQCRQVTWVMKGGVVVKQ
ncbi:MAG: amidohydrolase family protein [Chitinophagaceae bacterium]